MIDSDYDNHVDISNTYRCILLMRVKMFFFISLYGSQIRYETVCFDKPITKKAIVVETTLKSQLQISQSLYFFSMNDHLTQLSSLGRRNDFFMRSISARDLCRIVAPSLHVIPTNFCSYVQSNPDGLKKSIFTSPLNIKVLSILTT